VFNRPEIKEIVLESYDNTQLLLLKEDDFRILVRLSK
jgi:hypothetical protein